MTTEIHVAAAGEADVFRVDVTDRSGSREYRVTCTPAQAEEIAPGHSPADVVEASFRFLLDREPKESILARFDLPVIERYFPSYRREILEYVT